MADTELMRVAEEAWKFEDNLEQVEALCAELKRGIEVVEQETKERDEENAKVISVYTKMSALKMQLIRQENDLVKEWTTKELEASANQSSFSAELKKIMDSLHTRLEVIPAQKEALDEKVNKTREELLAIHAEITKDQPEIDEGIKIMDTFNSSSSKKPAADEEGVGEADEEAAAAKKKESVEEEAKAIGLTTEELEAFNLSTEEYEKRDNDLREKELETKITLLDSNEGLEEVQKQLKLRSDEMTDITGKVERLLGEVRAAEQEIAVVESRRDNMNAKFANEDKAIKEALEESKKLDRLLEALTVKAEKEGALPTVPQSQEATSENTPPVPPAVAASPVL
jgi:chromosome segregation ATPase